MKKAGLKKAGSHQKRRFIESEAPVPVVKVRDCKYTSCTVVVGPAASVCAVFRLERVPFFIDRVAASLLACLIAGV